MLKNIKLNEVVQYSSFKLETGCEEYFLTLNPVGKTHAESCLDSLFENLSLFLKDAGLTEKELVFSRVYFSDVSNQIEFFKKSELLKRLQEGAVSCIQQESLQKNPLSLFCYFIKSNSVKTSCFKIKSSECDISSSTSLKNYKLLWLTGLIGKEDKSLSSAKQTMEIFKDLKELNLKNGMALVNHVIRTWIFVRDLDNHYKGMTDARKNFFEKEGIGEGNYFPASTGIEGAVENHQNLVMVESLSIEGLLPEQIVKMQGLKNLSPTMDYHVTFERGLEIVFGDRSHFHISGTASINHLGEVLHLGNPELQTQRTLDNMEVLLKEKEASLKDMAYLIIYLRDACSKDVVLAVLKERFSHLPPFIITKAPVCRPGWLVEIEGVGIKAKKSSYPVFG